MTLSKFLHRSYQDYKNSKCLRAISNGYPIQDYPHTPKIMKNLDHFEIFKSDMGVAKVAIGSTKCDIEVDPKSLEMIKNFVITYLEKNFKLVALTLEGAFQPHVISVSIAETNFRTCENCGSFEVLCFEKRGFFTYKKLSPNVLATYYNENGKSFLAGTTYYPDFHGRLITIDQNLIFQEQTMSELYPLTDRNLNWNKQNLKLYGRYCKSSGRQVLLDCSGPIRHKKYNVLIGMWEWEECSECLEDSVTYDWEEEQKKFIEAGSIKEESPPTPTLPKIELMSWKTLPMKTIKIAMSTAKIPKWSTQWKDELFRIFCG